MPATDRQYLSRAELPALVGELHEAVANAEARAASAEARVFALEAELTRARKDFFNSSKPPPSDLVKPLRSLRIGRRIQTEERINLQVFEAGIQALVDVIRRIAGAPRCRQKLGVAVAIRHSLSASLV